MLHIDIVTVGKPQLSYAREGVDFYLSRLKNFAQVEIHHVKENKETERKILQIMQGKFAVLLDEKGEEFTSLELARFLSRKQTEGFSRLCFVIGGPDGHTPEIRQRADFALALSRLTFAHDLAMVVALEALYRALSLNVGHPYHRG